MKPTRPFFAVSSGAGSRRAGGFTLLEIMIASMAAAVILIAIYGIFARAVKMRDTATNQNQETRLRARAMNVIRNDLQNAYISGGILASSLQGGSTMTGTSSNLPGYLKLTTTTGKDTTDETYGDVEQVEYYIARDQSNPGTNNGGTLVRFVTRDILQGTRATVTRQEELLAGVQSLQISFYDGTTWQESWQSGTSSGSTMGSMSSTPATSGSTATSGTAAAPQNLPQAIRVDIQPAIPPGQNRAPAPMEVMVPWTTVPFLSGSNYTIGSDTPDATPAP